MMKNKHISWAVLGGLEQGPAWKKKKGGLLALGVIGEHFPSRSEAVLKKKISTAAEKDLVHGQSFASWK